MTKLCLSKYVITFYNYRVHTCSTTAIAIDKINSVLQLYNMTNAQEYTEFTVNLRPSKLYNEQH